MLRTISLVSMVLLAQACAASDTGTDQGQSGSGTADGEGDDGDSGGDDGGADGTGGGDDDGEDGDGGGHGDRDDCKIEGEDIGRDVVVELGSVSVSFGDWVGKEDSPGEYIGFTMTLEGAEVIAYRVKAGGEVFADTALTWVHPAGTSGPEASGISNVDMCDDDGDHGDDGGDGDGGDGGDDGDGGDHGDDGGDDGDGGDVDVG